MAKKRKSELVLGWLKPNFRLLVVAILVLIVAIFAGKGLIAAGWGWLNTVLWVIGIAGLLLIFWADKWRGISLPRYVKELWGRIKSRKRSENEEEAEEEAEEPTAEELKKFRIQQYDAAKGDDAKTAELQGRTDSEWIKAWQEAKKAEEEAEKPTAEELKQFKADQYVAAKGNDAKTAELQARNDAEWIAAWQEAKKAEEEAEKPTAEELKKFRIQQYAAAKGNDAKTAELQARNDAEWLAAWQEAKAPKPTEAEMLAFKKKRYAAAKGNDAKTAELQARSDAEWLADWKASKK